MITKDQIRQVIYDQRGMYNDLGVERDIDPMLVECPEVLVLTGIRRSGKSVLMQQIRSRQADKDYFISFDDDRLLHFTADDFQLLYDVFVEDFGIQHTFYLDEIQLIEGWERFVGRIYSHGNKVIVTGSNAKMLSRELGTLLTGRHVTKEVYPFSLSEYARYVGLNIDTNKWHSTVERAKLNNLQSDYLSVGGFPQYVATRNADYLKALYNDIVYRDIIVRHNIASDKMLKEIVFYLVSNATHLFTYNSIAKSVGVKSSETVCDYITYMEESYLVGQLTKYSNKVGEQIRSPKKIYFADNALVSRIGFTFSSNDGVRLENAVYVELCRRGGNIYYYNEGKECDFVVRNDGVITRAYQVCLSLADTNTRQREVAGITDAMKDFGLKEGFIITKDETDEIAVGGIGLIHVLPFHRWALMRSFS